MKTPISVGFRIFYVILDFEHLNVILFHNDIGDLIDIVDKRTDDPHARHIEKIVFHGIREISKPFLFNFL